MNQEPENKITDQQLDDMLRDVQVPADLKDRLLKIPHTAQQDPSLVNLPDAAPAELPRTRWLPYVLVATLLVIAGVVATQWQPNNSKTPDVIAKQDENNNPQTREAQAHRLAIEQSRIEQQLAHGSARSYLDPEDVTSMIMALAPEYTVELGGSKTDLESEMALVREKFPQSRGADLAQQILQQLN